MPDHWSCLFFFHGLFKSGWHVFVRMLLHTHAMIVDMAVDNGMFVKGPVMTMRENMRVQMGMMFYESVENNHHRSNGHYGKSDKEHP